MMNPIRFLKMLVLGVLLIALLTAVSGSAIRQNGVPAAQAAAVESASQRTSIDGSHSASQLDPEALTLGQIAALKGPETLLLETQGYFTQHLPLIKR